MQDIEDAEKLALLNAELDNLKDKLSKSAESEKKIMELENQLKLAKSKSEEQASVNVNMLSMLKPNHIDDFGFKTSTWQYNLFNIKKIQTQPRILHIECANSKENTQFDTGFYSDLLS